MSTGPSIQRYGTPWHLVRQVERDSFAGQRFALDACAEGWSAKAAAFCSLPDNDGKHATWRDATWCNPPYEEQDEWLALGAWWAKRGVRSAHLVIASTSAKYWRPLVWTQGTCDLFEGRIEFIAPPEGLRLKRKDGERVISGGAPVPGFDRASALILFGPGFVPGAVRTRCAMTGQILSWASSAVAPAGWLPMSRLL